MTDPKLTSTGGIALTKDGARDRMQALLHDGRDLKGLVSDRQTKMPEGIVERSSSATFMRRVALAIVQQAISLKEGQRPNVSKALEQAGCDQETYLQLISDPDWDTEMRRLEYELILRPRMARVKLSLSELAMTGDVSAAKVLLSMTDGVEQLSEDPWSAAINAGGADAAVAELGNIIRDMRDIQERLAPSDDEASPAVRDAVAKIAGGPASRAIGNDDAPPIDHATIHSSRPR